MSTPRDYGKLRHLHPAGDWVALYAIPMPPYIHLLPVVSWVLLTKDSVEKVVGFVGAELAEAYPADQYPNGLFSRFMNLTAYRYTPEVYEQIITEVKAEGMALQEHLLTSLSTTTEGDESDPA